MVTGSVTGLVNGGAGGFSVPAHRFPHFPLVDVSVGLEPRLLVVPPQVSQEPEHRGSETSECGPSASYGFQNPCEGIRNARLKREEAFSHAMIIVSSAMVLSS
jgi:hypothetical protein